mgnify:CR=1 FL=1
MERKVINEYEQAELISSRYAKQLRKEVNTLEDYSLKETSNTLTYDMINLARGLGLSNELFITKRSQDFSWLLFHIFL